MAEIIGPDIVDELAIAEPNVITSPRTYFTNSDLRQLQEDIAKTVRPSHSTSPPKKIGTKAQGKLKAAEWRAVIEFELPVFLMKYWYAADTANLNARDKARHDLAIVTMRLACALRMMTSCRTSQRHKDASAMHMRAYLEGILRQRPDLPLLPSHHYAMHIPDFLPRFGPVPGWWMFPFERVIGKLQQIHTNGKLGEISTHTC